MSGIYQLNQATGSATSPSSGSTFIGTNHTNQLFTKNSSGTVTVYGTGGGSTIDTGSFATTGSNNFTGSQFVDGNLQVTASGYIIGSQIRNAEGDNVTIVDNLIVDGTITANNNISSSGTVIADNLNIDASNASSSLSVGIEEKVPALGILNITSSGIVNQAYPLGNTGRITYVLGNTTLGLGGASYTSDGENVFYKSGSLELWRQVGEVDLSTVGGVRTVGHSMQFADNSLGSTAGTYNEFQVFSGQNVGAKFGGAHFMARYSGSTDTLRAGFFASSSLGNPGTPHNVDRTFTIFTGANTTSPSLNIYNISNVSEVNSTGTVFSIGVNGSITGSSAILNALPTIEPTTTGSLWISGSSVAHPNSGYLMVFNP